MSLIIRGRMFTAGKITESAVRIENGLIVAVSDRDLGAADTVVNLEPQQTLLPAAVDTLCALRDWGEASRDTVETATRAALAGGITVVCDQSNTVPRLNTADLVRKRSEFVAARSYVDFGIQPHPPRDPDDLERYPEAGAFAVSFWQWDLRPWNYPRDIDDSNAIFRRCAELGLKGLVFPDELTLRETPLEEQAERYALEALLRRMDPSFHCRVFVTLPESVERLLESKERYPNLMIQIAPHYLLMSREEAFKRIGSAAAHSPPLRSERDVERLQDLAAEGKIDILVSHHTPHRTVDKYAAQPIPGEFTPKRGFTSVDFAYPLCLTRLGIERTCAAFCQNPAAHLGIKKGVIARGYEADLVIFEEAEQAPVRSVHESGGVPSSAVQVDPAQFQSLGKVTPFVGDRLKYRVVATYLRGERVYDASSRTFTRTPVKQIRAPHIESLSS
ncbi:MAG TPA: dihydroorotase family protein [Steroidobacter sp.]